MTSDLQPLVSEVEERCQGDKLVSLFLDFDGTLTPIMRDPGLPRLDAATREVLQALARKPWCVTTIITGRALDDVYQRVQIERLIYAANHGLEIRGPNLFFLEPSAAQYREKLAGLCDDLRRRLHSITGALVEYKGLTASVHFRQVAPEEVEALQDVVRLTICAGTPFRTNVGRKVIEITPPVNWHKGRAARWINLHLGRDESGIVPIYFGDDATDEDAFFALNGAITVKVGGCPTRAKFRVAGPDTVHDFLRWLVDFQPRTEISATLETAWS